MSGRARLLLRVGWLVAGLLANPTSVSAQGPPQPIRIGDTNAFVSAPIAGTDVAYDPVHQVSLVVTADGPLTAVFVDNAGLVVGSPFTMSPGAAPHTLVFPRVKYSPDVNAGAGGFLVTWHQNHGTSNFRYWVHSRVFSYPTGPVGSEGVIADEGITLGSTFLHGGGAAIAYSPTSHVFLVTWQRQDGGGIDQFGIEASRVGLDAQPIGSVIAVEGTNVSKRPSWPDVAWNPSTDEFGVSYSRRIFAGGIGGQTWGAAYFARVSSGGVLLATSQISNAGSHDVTITDVDCNTATGHWVMAWWEGYGSHNDAEIKAAEIDATGSAVTMVPFSATQFFVSRTLAGSPEALNVSYNAASGTFLLSGLDLSGTGEVAAAELDGHGVMIGAERAVTRLGGAEAFYPRAAPQTGTMRWTISLSRYFSTLMDQVVSSSSSGDVDSGTDTIPGPGGNAGPGGSPYPGTELINTAVRGTDIAFDPVHQVYLVVGADGPLVGVFVDRLGQALTSPFTLTGVSPSAVMPRVRFAPGVNGGAGGFLVTWSQLSAGAYEVHARAVGYPTGPIGSEGVIASAGQPGGQGFVGTGAAVAYSITSQVFYVAWQRQDSNFGVEGRLVGLDAQPLGTVRTIENSGHARYPAVAWHVNDSFGVSYSRDIQPPNSSSYDWTAVYLAGISAFTGAVADPLGPIQIRNAGSGHTDATDIDFNPATATWLIAWYETPPGGPPQIRVSERKAGGAPANAGLPDFLISERLAGNHDAVSFSYNKLSQTFLIVGLDASGSGDVVGLELNGHGLPVGAARPVAALFAGTAWSPHVISSGKAGLWGLAFSRNGNTLMDRIVSIAPPGPVAAPSFSGSVVDFTGDHRSDLIWQDPATGQAVLWEMNGATHVSSTTLTSGGTMWEIAGTGDFTGDGNLDLIWQQPTTGAVLLWEMDGTSYVSSTILSSGSTYWKVVAVGDFTGDGQPDIVWQLPATGAVLLWEMNGATYVSSIMLSPGSTFWQVVGAGDFTGDGNIDLLWQHPSTGAVLLWEMNGTTYISSTILNGGTTWHVAAIADFTGDGKPDIVWQLPSTGEVLLWEMNGTSYVGSTILGVGGTTWKVRAPK